MHIPTVEKLFCDTKAGAKYAEVDSLSFVPFDQTGEPTRYRVLRFVSIFARLDPLKLGPAADGVACGSNSAIVVQVEDFDLHIV